VTHRRIFSPTISDANRKTLAASISQERKNTSQPPHIVVIARAGTGKTTTAVEGLKVIRGQKPGITPSPQQKAIWDLFAQSKGAAKVGFMAFNRSIADELQRRVPQGVDAINFHRVGNKAIRAVYPRIQLEESRTDLLAAEVMDIDVWKARRERPVVMRAVRRLVSLLKYNLIGLSQYHDVKTFGPNEPDSVGEMFSYAMDRLCAHYDIDCEDKRDEAYRVASRVLFRAKNVDRDGAMDFADMVWLPLALGLPFPKYDFLIVDEAQDLNRCQQAIALKSGTRICLIGDDKQAIYGFTGADSDSLPRLGRELKSTPQGCEVLPLNVTRRCGKAIVQEAQKLVKDIEWFPEGENLGRVTHATMDTNKPKEHYASIVEDGDMVLCRTNGPLVQECFKFLRQGRKANIQGRDVGSGLISTIDRLMKSWSGTAAEEIPEFIRRLDEWTRAQILKEEAKKSPSTARMITLVDRMDCLICFTENAKGLEEVKKKIQDIFSDDKREGILFSSVHKAKGLEANRVFILQPEDAKMPHPMAKTKWQVDQEYNLLYVAITRAIKHLVYVSGPSTKNRSTTSSQED